MLNKARVLNKGLFFPPQLHIACKDESSWKGKEFIETKYFQPRETEHYPKVLFIYFCQSELKTRVLKIVFYYLYFFPCQPAGGHSGGKPNQS